MIDRSFVEKIEDMAKVEVVEIDGRNYTSQTLQPVYEAEAKTIPLVTLTGIRDYLSGNMDDINHGQVMIHVMDYRSVSIISPIFGGFRQREVLAQSIAHDCGFPFGKYIPREEFQIGLMAMFLPTENRDNLLRYVSGIAQSAEVKTSDDGISQRVTTRAGIARVAEVDLPNPIALRPFRTFVEAEQPESEFVIRVRKSREDDVEAEQPKSEFVFRVKKSREDDVKMALFESDGGQWKLQAALNVKKWLETNILGVRVIV